MRRRCWLVAVALVWAARVFAVEPGPADWRDSGVVATHRSAHTLLHEVPIRAVRIDDGFWPERMAANRRAGLPKLLQRLEEHGALDNFRRVSGRKACSRRGPLYTDSDVYKWVEAAALALQSQDDPALRKDLDSVIDEVLAAQQKDGYINTYYVDERANQRFTKLGSDHELYCAGHLFQAAVAHYRATGTRPLLDGALRFADYLCSTFGPDKKVQGHCGHPEVEMSLIELYRTTGNQKYLDLAGYYLDDYGFTRETGVHGHAVRMMYVSCGGTDYYAETGHTSFLDTAGRLWTDLTAGKEYITGGIGARHDGEAIGEPFELPNRMAYAETCAAIAATMWEWRMLAVEGQADYADAMERRLYNGVLSGVSLEGSDWFYVNPLACSEADVKARRAQRQPWFDTTCCPSNMVRTLAAMPGYLFSTSPQGLWVHLYASCRLDWKLEDGTRLQLVEKTNYPWEGQVQFEVKPEREAEFELNVRVPTWCPSARVKVNGKDGVAATPGNYCRLTRRWRAGDVVTLELSMPVIAVAADDRIVENRGRIALQRGPLVYCLEGVDNPGVALDRACLKLDAAGECGMKPAPGPSALGNLRVLRGEGFERPADSALLYRPVRGEAATPGRPVELTAIPYYAWANRAPAAMAVWINYAR